MAEAFECPKCGAPLDLKPEDLVGKETVACPYCGESVIIPADMQSRGAAKEALRVQMADLTEMINRETEYKPSYESVPTVPPAAKPARRSITGCVVVAVILALVIGAIGIFAVFSAGNQALKAANGIVSEQTSTNPAAPVLTQAALMLKTAAQLEATVEPATLAELTTPTPADSPTPAIDTTATAEFAATQVAQSLLIATQSNWPVVLQEKFANDQRNWTTGQDNSNLAIEESTIAGNKYTWKITTKKSMGSFTFPDMADQTDLYVSVDMQMTTSSGNTEDQSGIIFRRSASDNSFYFFGVNPAGAYSLSMYDGSNWSDLIPTTQTTLLKTGQVNHLAVSMQDSLILLVINNTVVDSFEDSQLSSGSAGLGLNLPSPGEDATVIFTNFYVRAPKK